MDGGKRGKSLPLNRRRALKILSIFPQNTFDELVKSRNSIEFVIPAKAGIQLFQDVLDPGFRRGDAPRDFLRDHQFFLLPL
jgi:hypothetical protein